MTTTNPASDRGRRTLHIGELARRSGRTVHAIRWYESIGLVPGVRRDAANHRVYDQRHIELVGRYINLSDTTVTRPWVGLIVDAHRIDGRWTNGRLDFRR